MTVLFLRSHHVAFALRLLPPVPLALVMIATIINIVVFAEALYLRAHKQEKFLINSIAGAVWMVPISLFLGRYYGAYGIALGYLVTAIVIGMGFGSYTFLKWRRIWHAA